MSGPGDEFLFLNFDKGSLGSKQHLGRVNAHVHAHARAKKKKQREASERLNPSPTTDSSGKAQFTEAGPSFEIPERLRKRSRAKVRAKKSGWTSDLVDEETEPPLTFTPSTLPETTPTTPVGDESVLSINTTSSGATQLLRNTSLKSPTSQALVPLTTGFVSPATSGGLDPFLHLPSVLSHNETNLVALYLTNFGPAVYGTRQNAVFDPSRDISLPNMLNDELVMNWIVIQAEAAVARRKGITDTPNTVLVRRAQAYRAMNERLKDPTSDLESVFGCMLAAVISDARELGPQVANLHLKGLAQVLKQRGGMKVLFSDKKVVGSFTLFAWAHHHTSNAGGISDTTQLADYKQKFFSLLRKLRTFNQTLRRQLAHVISRQRILAIMNGNEIPRAWQSSQSTPLESYGAIREECLSTSCLRPLLDSDYPCETFVDQTCHFSNLFNLNLSLWYFRNNLASSTSFLRRILNMFIQNGTVDPVTGWTSLKQTYLYWVLSVSRMEIGPDFVDREIAVNQEIIRMLKIRHLLSEQSRYKLTKVLSNWLLNAYEDGIDELSDQELEDMEKEVDVMFLLPGT